MSISAKIKSLRKEKNVSQEKLAQYLNVSFQAVSKWENNVSMPDITLLPDIARFFGITVDELLQVECIDEDKLYEEYYNRAAELFRDGKRDEALELWKEAYQKMPNRTDVKEYLMSAYYDADKVKYADEIIELGTELYNGDLKDKEDDQMYFKSQAIREIANTYAATGRLDLAKKWANKATTVFNSRELILFDVEEGGEMLGNISFCTYWFLEEMFYFANSIAQQDSIPELTNERKMAALEAVIKVFNAVYPDGEMGFEQLQKLMILNWRAAIFNAQKRDSEAVKRHLMCAAECAGKSVNTTEHKINQTLIFDWQAASSPNDNKQAVRELELVFSKEEFDICRHEKWFEDIRKMLSEA